MKKILNSKKIKFAGFSIVLLLAMGCTDLEFENEDGIIPEGTGDASDLLVATYGQLSEFANERTIFGLSGHSSDELIGPTRGTDWFDGGVFQQMHKHTWTADNTFIRTAWEEINTGVYRATLVVAAGGTALEVAEAKVLRAFYMFHVVDFWGIAPFREAGTGVESDPMVMTGEEATDFIIDDLESALPDLNDASDFTVVNKNTARALLAKIYLNKAVFSSGDRSSGAFTFDAADMSKVVEYVDAIEASALYALTPGLEGYFNTFSNGSDQQSSTELIFAIPPSQLVDYKRRWNYTLHYNQKPSGWNGFATLSNFYDAFEEDDVRRGGAFNSAGNPFTDNTGTNVGFLVGQQVDNEGNELTTRNGSPLNFTREVSATTNTEETGIRVVKVVPDFREGTDFTESPTNNHVLLRYGDALLNKAEALLRGGTSANGETAQEVVDAIRTARGVAPITVNEDNLLEERGRELYWEGWRRNDLIRFGKFLDAWQEKEQSGVERVLFPIPVTALVTNPNLSQNPGY